MSRRYWKIRPLFERLFQKYGNSLSIDKVPDVEMCS
jgi:hypothetical protein